MKKALSIPAPIARWHHHSRENGYTGKDKVWCFDCGGFFSPIPPPEEPQAQTWHDERESA